MHVLGGSVRWQKTAKETKFWHRDINSIIWAEFVEVFKEQYFPKLVVQQNALEFTNLNARDRFGLKCFSPGSLANEKARRADKFFEGVRVE